MTRCCDRAGNRGENPIEWCEYGGWSVTRVGHDGRLAALITELGGDEVRYGGAGSAHDQVLFAADPFEGWPESP
jgi:hypothetical protein